MSKHKQIEKHLRDRHSITGIESMNLYNVYRLSQVIMRIRDKDIRIVTEMVKGKTEFARYWLPSQKMNDYMMQHGKAIEVKKGIPYMIQI